MKNINIDFCYKKKISKLYYKGIFVCFQSFLPIAELQNKLGDHRVNVYFFNINNFWNKHYPVFYCSNVNSYVVYLKNCTVEGLTSWLAHADLNVFYILISNRFYNPSYFQNIIKEKKNFYIMLQTITNNHFLGFMQQLQKVFAYFMFLLTNIKK